MPSLAYPSLRSLLTPGRALRVAGAHTALGARLAQEAGFDAVWSSSLEISASRCLPDASLLTMTEYVDAARHMQHSLRIPVVADVDTGYGNNLNAVHMVHEYQAAGITAVCMEDKVFPKMNSFADATHALLEADAFASKIRVAKQTQTGDEFMVVARTESLIAGLGIEEALRRCVIYVDAGADAVLIHSKASTNHEILAFLRHWNGRSPVVVVPTTYPDWVSAQAAKDGVSAIIYANQGLRATITALRSTFGAIIAEGATTSLEDRIAPVSDVFKLQDLAQWQRWEKV